MGATNETVKIAKDGILYLFGNLFNKAIAFITVPIFTRLLTTEEYGIVNTYTAWVTMLAVIVGLSLGNSIRNAYIDYNNKLGEYISSIFFLALINFVIILIIVLCFVNKVDLDKKIILLCLVESFANFIVNSIIMKFVMEQEAVKRTCLLILPNLFGAILSIIMILNMNNEKYYGRIIATCSVTAIFGFGMMGYYFVKYRVFFDKKYWLYALPISIPLVFHGLSTNILGTSDRTIITYFVGAAATGVYSLIYNLSMVANVVTSSAESIWIPRFTKNMMEGKVEAVNQEARIYIYIEVFAFCGLLTLSPELVLMLGGEKYISGFNMISPIVLSAYAMFMYSMYVNIEYYYKKTNIIAIGTIVSALLNLILNVIFVPKYGAVAAAYTTLVSYIANFIIHCINSKRINKKLVPIRLWIIPTVIMILGVIILNFTFYSYWLRWLIMIFLGVIYLFVTYQMVFKRRNYL